MTIETDLNVMEHAGRTWRFTLKNESGEVLPLDGYVIYGAAECPGRALRAFTVEVKDGVATVRMPGLPAGDWPWKYQLFVQEVSSRVEWLLCCGSVNVLGRVAGGHVALSPEQLEFTGVLDRVTQQASIVVGENMVSIAENVRHAAQAALDSQIARDGAEAARDGALAALAGAEAARDGAEAARDGAEAARDGAEAARDGAEAARDGAEAARSGAEDARDGAEAARSGAEAARDGAEAARSGAEDARDGAEAARSGAEDARDGALAAQGGAEDARDGALAAQGGAEDARDGALAARSGAEGAQAVAEDAAGVAQGFAQRAAGAADDAVLAAAEAKAAEAGAAGAADAVRFDLLPLTLDWLESRFTAALGEGNITMTLNGDETALTVAVSLDTTEAQIAEVESLLERVLPRNLVRNMEWADGLPMSYTRLEYIESSGTQRIDTGRLWNAHDEISILYEPIENSKGKINYNIFGASTYRMAATKNTGEGVYFELPSKHAFTAVIGRVKTNAYYSFTELRVNEHSRAINIAEFESSSNIFVCDNAASGAYPAHMRLYSYQHKKPDGDNMYLIPARSPIGQPGMFDTATKVFKTYVGTDDFLYPGMETEATTYSLRNRIYGKITEHGIRRLYRVPEGYNSKEEYAEANGFKLLVETPMPEEGYWTPVWHDRDDCIELEWIETEPPMEEL